MKNKTKNRTKIQIELQKQHDLDLIERLKNELVVNRVHIESLKTQILAEEVTLSITKKHLQLAQSRVEGTE